MDSLMNERSKSQFVEIVKETVPFRLKLLHDKLGIEIPILENKSVKEISELLEKLPKERKSTIEPKEDPPTSVDEIEELIDKMHSAVNRLYVINGIYDFQAQTTGFPLGIYSYRKFDYRYIGGWNKDDSWYPPPSQNNRGVCQFPYYGRGQTYDVMDVSFEDGGDFDFHEPYCWADRSYSPYQNSSLPKVRYGISICHHYDDRPVQVYFNNQYLTTFNQGDSMKSFSFDVDLNHLHHSPRDPVRHNHALAEQIREIFGDIYGGYYLEKVRSANGFTFDAFDPIFNASKGQTNDHYIHNMEAYKDCPTWNQLPGYPAGSSSYKGSYPYYSKVCRGICAYLTIETRDRQGKMLSAIHGLNKYHNPDHVVSIDSDDGCWINGYNITPRGVARDMEQNCWCSAGVNAYGQDANVGSPYRTALLLALESILGWKYNDYTSRAWADTAYSVLKDQIYDIYVWDENLNLYLRPDQCGMVMVPCKKHSEGVYIPAPLSILREMMDYFNMPDDDLSPRFGNIESTIITLQAFRIYLHYKYGVNYPNNMGIPDYSNPAYRP